MPRLNHIVAVSENGVIGKNGQLPWHFPSDLKYFKAITIGSTVVMGRKTFDSIGKALPGRRNIVISRTPTSITASDVEPVSSIEAALQLCGPSERVFVIGGSEIFAATFDQVEKIYLTRIGRRVDGDTYYPLEGLYAFKLETETIHYESTGEALHFCLYTRDQQVLTPAPKGELSHVQ